MAKSDDGSKVVASLDGQSVTKTAALDWCIAEANRADRKLQNASSNRRGAEHAARRSACIEVGTLVKQNKLPEEPLADLRTLTGDVFNRIHTPSGGAVYDAAAELERLATEPEPATAEA
jgi:hypothetical protein